MAIQKYSQMKNRGDGKKFRVFANNSKVVFKIRSIKEVKKNDYIWDKVAKKAVRDENTLVDFYRVVCEANLPESDEYNNIWVYDVKQTVNDSGHGSPTKLEKFVGAMVGHYKMPDALYENLDRVKPFLMSCVGKEIKVMFSFDGKRNKPEQITAVEEVQDLDNLLKSLDAELSADVEADNTADFDSYPDSEEVKSLVADTFTYDVSKVAKEKQDNALKILKAKNFSPSKANANHWTGEVEIKALDKFKVVHDEADLSVDDDDIPF